MRLLVFNLNVIIEMKFLEEFHLGSQQIISSSLYASWSVFIVIIVLLVCNGLF